jgi:hypothetical protein
MGTSGPETEVFSPGLDSRRTACAREGDAVRNQTATTANTNTIRVRRPEDMEILLPLAANPKEFTPDWPERLYPS